MMEMHANRITNDGETAQESSLWFMLFSSKVNEKKCLQCIASRTQLCVIWKKCWSVLETP